MAVKFSSTAQTVSTVQSSSNPRGVSLTSQPTLYASNDGKDWIVRAMSMYNDVMEAYAYVDIVSDGRRDEHKRPEKRAKTRDATKHDFKLGSLGLMFDREYTLTWSPKGTSRVNKGVKGKGKHLCNKIVELAATGANKFAVTDGESFPQPVTVHQARKVLGIAEKVKPSPVAVNPDKPSDIAIEFYYDRAYTWFAIAYNGEKVTDSAQLTSILGAHWLTEARQRVQCPTLWFANKRGELCAKEVLTHSQIDALASWLDNFKSIRNVNVSERVNPIEQMSTDDLTVPSGSRADDIEKEHDREVATMPERDAKKRAEAVDVVANALQAAIAALQSLK